MIPIISYIKVYCDIIYHTINIMSLYCPARDPKHDRTWLKKAKYNVQVRLRLRFSSKRVKVYNKTWSSSQKTSCSFVCRLDCVFEWSWLISDSKTTIIKQNVVFQLHFWVTPELNIWLCVCPLWYMHKDCSFRQKWIPSVLNVDCKLRTWADRAI